MQIYICRILSGLPEKYETLVTALDARPNDELTLSKKNKKRQEHM